MTDGSGWRYLLPEPVRTLPVDLAAVLALTVATAVAVLAPGVQATPLRVVLGLPFVLFAPGYALVAALFPEAGGDGVRSTLTDAGTSSDGGSNGSADVDSVTDVESDPNTRGDAADAGVTDDGATAPGIDGVERVALSAGLSVAVVPLLGLALNFTPWGLRTLPIVLTLGGFTLAATAVAHARRRTLPPDARFQVPLGQWTADARAELFDPPTRTDAVLNVVLVCSVVLAVGAVGYAVAVPQPGESFSELYLLTESEDGDLVADDYPTNYTAGQARPLVVGIGNHEHERTTYTVVVQLQRVERTNETVSITRDGRERTLTAVALDVSDRDELARYQRTVDHNDSVTDRQSIAPTMTGENLRLAVLLYVDDVPQTPTVANAYREVHLWIDVEPAGPG